MKISAIMSIVLPSKFNLSQSSNIAFRQNYHKKLLKKFIVNNLSTTTKTDNFSIVALKHLVGHIDQEHHIYNFFIKSIRAQTK